MEGKTKRKANSDSSPNVNKKAKKDGSSEKSNNIKQQVKTDKKTPGFAKKTTNNGKGKPNNASGKFSKPFKQGKFGGKKPNEKSVKPADWNEFKKQKKELKAKRRQNKPLFDSVVVPKQLGEKIRCKKLAADERQKLIEKVHNQVKGKELYPKFVLTHDMARLVQILLKFGSAEIREEIIKELIPTTMQMMDSKYGKFVIKRMLKYSNAKLRSSTIKAMYGNAVKLTSHALSAPIFEYAYSTWATPQEKHHLVQEFFGDMYKNSKDDNVKHLKDVYETSPDMKTAALGATKSNLQRILNKSLLDSALVQTVVHQFLTECSDEDRTELISQLASHSVILSNSKDGARAVMNCIWHGSNKDRKVLMKALKEHVLELSKHEHGHSSILALLDAADDTVLLNKMIITEIVKHAEDLSKDVTGRKVLLWLVAPADSTHFHPIFIKELEAGRATSTCKKSPEIRRKEILEFASNGLLKAISANPSSWLSSGPIGIVSLAILKTGCGENLQKAFKKVAKLITDPDWKVMDNDKEVSGVEHTGLHMILKKLAQHDKVLAEKGEETFGDKVLSHIQNVLPLWLTLNRGCFLLVALFENGNETTQNKLKEVLDDHKKVLKKQSNPGAKILLKKLG